jgi:hypothetical protein
MTKYYCGSDLHSAPPPPASYLIKAQGLASVAGEFDGDPTWRNLNGTGSMFACCPNHLTHALRAMLARADRVQVMEIGVGA